MSKWLFILLLWPVGGFAQPVLRAPELGAGRYLRYETMDIVFYIPYGPDLVEAMERPWEYRLIEEEPGLWEAWEAPQYMAEWAGIVAQFREGHVASLDGREKVVRMVYVWLGKELERARVPMWDVEDGSWIEKYQWDRYEEEYECPCLGGGTARGTITNDHFFTRTPQTAILTFYTRQNRMRSECCYIEFPDRQTYEQDHP